MDNQLPKGLSLNEINEKYSIDDYRMRRAKRLHGDDAKKVAAIQQNYMLSIFKMR